MPELPEVETVCRCLAPLLVGQRFTKIECRRRSLRTAFPRNFPAAILNVPITGVTRRAKFIQIHFNAAPVLLLHLGMSGRLFTQNGPPQKHDHILFTLTNGTELRFNDARRFGLLDLVPEELLPRCRWLHHLGPEPFDPQVNGEWLHAALQQRRGPVKPALMDQKLWVGVGNIYASEALFRARISPRRAAHNVTAKESAALLKSVRAVLNAAIKAGGSSLRDYRQPDGEMGYFHTRFTVYNRAGAPCPRCAVPIRQLAQAGRSSFYCPECQP